MLHYQVFGEGTPVVFLHGFLESSTMWSHLQLSKLSAQCILIDLPGHGKSNLIDAPEVPSISWMAQEVHKVLEHLHVNAYRLVGHSLGAYVGLELNQLLPCQKFIFLNSNCWNDDEKKRKDRLRVADLVYTAKNHFIREAIPALFGHPSIYQVDIQHLILEANEMTADAIAFSALAMRERKDYTSVILAEPEKYMFIHGGLDTLVSTEDLQKRIPGIPVYVIPNAGHMSHIEAKDEVMEIVEKKIF